MQISSNGAEIFYQVDGPDDGPTVMFANSLGTDSRVWDPIIPYLTPGLRLIRFDKRGHGQSSVPTPPYDIETLAADAEAIIETVGATNVLFVGLSIGGLIGQALASRRPDLLKGFVLMDSGAKLGTAEIWQTRIDAIKAGGVEGISDAILDRWFAPEFRNDEAKLAPWRALLLATPKDGYIGCSAAIAAADYRKTTPNLTVPMTAMVGEYDGATPPELVKETAAMVGAPCHFIANAGHLPCVEQPEVTARIITDFQKEISHV